MRVEGGREQLYATDLTNFLGCRHLTVLERLAAYGRARRPHFEDPMLELLRERGLEHERAFVQFLASHGKRIVEIDKSSRHAFDDTRRAMHQKADVIVQARLEHGRWAGWADVLIRVQSEHDPDVALYEPVETKLARETRGATLIQLCLYAELLAEMQGRAPSYLQVVVPNAGYEPERYRFDEFRAYFRFVRRHFEEALGEPLPSSVGEASPYPEPVPHCDYCNWYSQCDERRRRDDHLSLVAGITRSQRKELSAWRISTLAELAGLPLPIGRKPTRGSVVSLERVREQARLQLEARRTATPPFELLRVEPGHGLAALPAPSPLDLFLDLEGDRLAEGGGCDYLFGYAFRDEEGISRYECLWALSPAEEKAAFERLIDVIADRRRRDAGAHVYHYAPYEPTAMKRLVGRYATRSDVLDELLRGDVFVDLYAVVRKSLQAGVESYSIKKLEPLYGLLRDVDLRFVSRELRTVEYAIARNDAASLSEDTRSAVQGYNRDDCISAMALRDWLETLRADEERRLGADIPRPTAPAERASETLSERVAKVREVADALTSGLPPQRSRDEDAQWTLAQLLEWHRREENAEWWEFFRLTEMKEDELIDERAGIAGLAFEARLETTKRAVVVDRYKFPPQETDVAEGDELFEPGSATLSAFARVDAIDLEHGHVDLRKGAARADLHARALFRHERIANPDAAQALLRLGEFVRDHGIDAGGQHRSARDLLLRRNPRVVEGTPWRLPDETAGAAARRVAVALDGGVLAVQGPPGTGKTFTGARIIVDLVRAGLHVGVTANSHKVIRHLLDEAVRAAAEAGVRLPCMHRVTEKSKTHSRDIEEVTDPALASVKVRVGGYKVYGGTAWMWTREELAKSVDVLVVDEAGQMSLANVLACAHAARNLILLGDPQQLQQPQKARHADGAELSALEYFLEGHATIPEERGLFLGETWRMHPSLCSFTSDLFYEGRLHPRLELSTQAVGGKTRFGGAGLFYVPVEHEGNQNTSEEEAEAIGQVVSDLTGSGNTWTDCHGATRPLTLDDILIVAPYNAQVAALAERIPNARVGTVDKFQGQEAPVVIFSTATSTPEDARRGMEFLFSRHRLNVATSRARGVCILVGNRRLFELECRTPEQMRMANAFCAYLERARVV